MSSFGSGEDSYEAALRTQKEQQTEWWGIDEEEIEQCRIQPGKQKVQDQPTRPNNQATTTNTVRKVREAEKTSDVLLAPVWTMSSKMLLILWKQGIRIQHLLQYPQVHMSACPRSLLPP